DRDDLSSEVHDALDGGRRVRERRDRRVASDLLNLQDVQAVLLVAQAKGQVLRARRGADLTRERPETLHAQNSSKSSASSRAVEPLPDDGRRRRVRRVIGRVGEGRAATGSEGYVGARG